MPRSLWSMELLNACRSTFPSGAFGSFVIHCGSSARGMVAIEMSPGGSFSFNHSFILREFSGSMVGSCGLPFSPAFRFRENRYEEPQWITKDPNAPEGKVERHAFKSSILHNERGISVYTPPGYNANPKSEYRLLFLFAGFDYQHSIPTPTILDNLIQPRKLPPTVAVMIDNPREFRISELEYNGAFVDFVGKVVLPWVHEHWNVTRDPRKSIVGGLSLGGSAAPFF